MDLIISIIGMYIIGYKTLTLSMYPIKLILLNITGILYPVIIYIRNKDIWIWTLYVLLIGMFITDDILIFYILFEISLIPMIIIIWSTYRQTSEGLIRKIEAANRIFLYTLLGSISILIAIIILWTRYGTTQYYILKDQIEAEIGLICWILLCIGFGIKIPIYPAHNWLPDAHSEAPTVGSMILAGIMLKIGTYGYIQYVLMLLNPYQNIEYSVFIYWFSVQSLIFTCIWSLRQTDLKKIIAYSSIVHMAITMLGLFSFDTRGIIGSLISIFSHGIVSPALFALCGFLYSRYATRTLYYYRGLSSVMPLYSILLVYFILANLSMPVISLSFVGEYLIVLGLFSTGILLPLTVVLSNVLLCFIWFWFMVKMIYGDVSINLRKINDLNVSETLSISPLLLISFIGGVVPYIGTFKLWLA